MVRPHVVGADSSLRLRYGALLDIRVPADRVASVRREQKFPDGKLAVVDKNGVADMAVADRTTVLVDLTEPVRCVRPLGKTAEARAVRFYAEDPVVVVTALKPGAASPCLASTRPSVPGPDTSVSHASSQAGSPG